MRVDPVHQVGMLHVETRLHDRDEHVQVPLVLVERIIRDHGSIFSFASDPRELDSRVNQFTGYSSLAHLNSLRLLCAKEVLRTQPRATQAQCAGWQPRWLPNSLTRESSPRGSSPYLAH